MILTVSNDENIYIRLRFDNVGLFTAQLVFDEVVIQNLGGSYSSWTPVMIHASKKWGGHLSTRWITRDELSNELRNSK